MQLTFPLALIAGLVSFLSPCVLPLVPAYIGYMGGRVTNTVAAQAIDGSAIALKPTLSSRFSTVLHGLAFVAGFTFVFVALGLLGTAFVSVIGRQNLNLFTGIIGRAGGLLIIFFGLHFMGILPSLLNRVLARRQALAAPLVGIPVGIIAALVVGAALLWIIGDWLFVLPLFALFVLWLVLGGAFTQPEAFWTRSILAIQRALYTDTRRAMVAQGHQSYAGSALMGVIFSAGWTPCIGPIYGSILTMAAMGGDVATAGTLLLAYSLGLGIPFVVAAFLLEGAQGILRHLQRHLHKIELVSGAFLVVIGVLVASGRLQLLSQTFSGQVSTLSVSLEDCAIKLSQGEITLGELANCVSAENASDAAPAATEATPEPQAALPSILDLAASAPESREVGLEIGKVAPGFDSVTDQNVSFRLADERGKVVLLNFWATWCGPCRVEMPQFEQAYTAKSSQSFTIVGVNNSESVQNVLSFRDELRLSFPLVLDSDARIQQLYGIRSYPSTYVLDRDGVIIAQHFGALTAEQIDALVDQALA